MDRRDTLTWVAIEITHQGEVKIEDKSLEATLRRDLEVDSSFPIFIPALIYSKNKKNVIIRLMDGYVFVASGLPEVAYFGLERKPYVAKVMSTKGKHGMRVLVVIDDDQIQSMRQQLHEQIAVKITVDDIVRITDGLYKSLEGLVIGTVGDQAIIEIKLRSLVTVTAIPKALLEVVAA